MKILSIAKCSLFVCAMILVFGFICKTSQALSFTVIGVNDPINTATVVLGYSGTTSTTGNLGISITNTATGLDPRVTAFALNTPTEITGVSGFKGPSGWNYNFSPNGIKTPGKLGFFDAAGTTNNNNNFNGGDPNDGIPKGQTFNFAFALTGTGMTGLNDMSFITGNPYFAVRFQRTDNGSDVATPGDPVPEPTTMLLLGTGMVGLVGVGIRRSRKNKK